MNGKLIVLEGINGCGKSTTARFLFELMCHKGYGVRSYRDPGATPIGERVRGMVKDPKLHMRPLTQMLLYTAARSELAHCIEDYLNLGDHIILDRWWPSTYAYQGAGGVDAKTVMNFMESTTPLACQAEPSLMFYIHVPVEVAMERSGALNAIGDAETGKDRFEAKGVEFQRQLVERYRELCKNGWMREVHAEMFGSAEELARYLFDGWIEAEIS